MGPTHSLARVLGAGLLMASCARAPATGSGAPVASQVPAQRGWPIHDWRPDSPDACPVPRFADSGRSLVCGSAPEAGQCFSGYGELDFTPRHDGGAAPPKHGDGGVRGSGDKELIRTIIRRHIDEVKRCYESKLMSRPQLSGRLVIQFVIDARGLVTASQVQSSTLDDRDVDACVGRAVCGWEFPKPLGGGIVIISYPFLLTPE
jgi:hypothetical protein